MELMALKELFTFYSAGEYVAVSNNVGFALLIFGTNAKVTLKELKSQKK